MESRAMLHLIKTIKKLHFIYKIVFVISLSNQKIDIVLIPIMNIFIESEVGAGHLPAQSQNFKK